MRLPLDLLYPWTKSSLLIPVKRLCLRPLGISFPLIRPARLDPGDRPVIALKPNPLPQRSLRVGLVAHRCLSSDAVALL